MHLTYDNVNDAFLYMVGGIATGEIHTVRNDTRNGYTLRIPEPVIITYRRPWQRVLFNPVRDTNPFFHLFESLWMLAGRNDLEPLTRYVKTFGQFSDDGKTLNGAYGYRWRRAVHYAEGEVTGDSGQTYDAWQVDQIDTLVAHLKAKPGSRRAVLQMWNVGDDLLKVDESRDCCCNLSVIFELEESVLEDRAGNPVAEMKIEGGAVTPVRTLNMTVTNRSNDLIWGTLGANAVHFSFLQEYMACRLNARIGVYNQFSTNQHVYDWNWKPDEWLAPYRGRTMHSPPLLESVYERTFNRIPLVYDESRFDMEVRRLIDDTEAQSSEYSEPFLQDVAGPMIRAHLLFKEGQYEAALACVRRVEAEDWMLAGEAWLVRRINKKGVTT